GRRRRPVVPPETAGNKDFASGQQENVFDAVAQIVTDHDRYGAESGVEPPVRVQPRDSRVGSVFQFGKQTADEDLTIGLNHQRFDDLIIARDWRGLVGGVSGAVWRQA